METSREYYTYAYLREDKTPYYIGKGNGNRAYRRRYKGIKPPKDKSRIIVLKQNLTEEEAFRHEVYMIAVFGRKDLGTGILHNRTNGGEGSSGFVPSEETRRKMSEAKKDRIVSEETKRKMSEAKKNMSDETRKKVSEKMSKNGEGLASIGGKKAKELGLGIHALTTEERREIGKKSSETNKKNKTGVYGMTFEQKSEGGKKAKELGLGVFAMTADELSEVGKKGAKITNFQKWECTETGYVANPGNLSKYQKRNGIDTSKRRRIP